jgi:lipid II:glycine glycyltransferase (peptidoglycan interpeptide bridge formation enzyme)
MHSLIDPAQLALSTSEGWDSALRSMGGHLLQSWRWGEFKSLHGWEPERVVSLDGSSMAQVLFRRKGPISVGYVPRGPAWIGDWDANGSLLQAIDDAARYHRTLYTIVEFDRAFGGDSPARTEGWSPGPEHIQPGRTVKVELGTDDDILKRMHQKTRYSVRLAMRKGVEVEQHEGLDERALATFYQLLVETSERNDFGIHEASYYQDFLRIFGADSLLEIAFVEGKPAAGLIAASFGDEAIYMYGGSSAETRAHGAAFLLQFEAMRWARDKGLARYDLWGIPMKDPETPQDTPDAVPATRGDDWRGLHRFKTGFGGVIVDYPPVLVRRYHRLGSRLAQRFARSIA